MLISYVKKGQLLFLATFAAMIAAGIGLLLLPWQASGSPRAAVDSVFTAVSAVCVTGLVTIDVSKISWPEQLIVITLVQLGALGIMTLSASILLALGKGLSFSNTLMISNLNDNFSLRRTEGLTRVVIRYTFFCEAVGAVFIYLGLMLNDPGSSGFGLGQIGSPKCYLINAWHAVFLAISGFCNAGFSPYPDSLFLTNPLVQLTVAGLVVMGGLGVYVIYDLLELFRGRRHYLRLHSKVVLATSCILVIVGTGLLWLLSRDGKELSFLDAFCLSVYSRTAGFSSFNEVGAYLSPGVATVVIVLMLLGGAPGSTAGGMKVTTVAVAFAAIRNTLQGNNEVLIFKRSIGMDVVLRAFTMMVLFLLLFCVSGAVLHVLNPDGIPLIESMFEAASAVTTTGMSMGTTGKLTDWGKIFVILLMIIGRLGPFTIMLFLLGREKPGQLKHPLERVIIG
ncbi:MAG: hypothetical protein IJT50_14415 [Lentisphaeria bacterium]|nr:hypothetical protein [Lentisphaeria bacterium]